MPIMPMAGSNGDSETLGLTSTLSATDEHSPSSKPGGGAAGGVAPRNHVRHAGPCPVPRGGGAGRGACPCRGGVRGGEVLEKPLVRGVQRPAQPGRVRALDLRPRGVVAVRGVRRRAALGRRLGRLGAQPHRRRHGRHAGAHRRAQGQRRRVRCPDVQHQGLLDRIAGGHHRLPDDRPRCRGRRRRPRPDVRRAHAQERHRGGEPGLAGGTDVGREHQYTRHGHWQHGCQGEAQPRDGGDHRLQRRGQHRQEEKYSWNSECCELGYSTANGRHSCQISQDIQISRPCLVLPSCSLPADWVWCGSVWLGHRYSSRKSVQGNHLLASQEYWDRCVCSWYPSDLRTVPEAQEGSQAAGVLERVPPLGGLHHHHPGHRQHLQGHDHPERGAEVEDGLHHRHQHPGRHRGGAGGDHLEHRLEEEEDGGQGLQRRCRRWVQRPLAALHVILLSDQARIHVRAKEWILLA